MKTLILFVLSILAWLASLAGSDLQPRQQNDGYPAPDSTATVIPLPPEYYEKSTPVPTDAMWRHYSP